ncbi:MAG TPA: ArdC family protein [Anaerolineae bacterium]|nr:ArdC family protein [Anaerolineae bacterium]
MKKTDVYQTVTNNILAAMENGIIPYLYYSTRGICNQNGLGVHKE